jgi:hypothetical protein
MRIALLLLSILWVTGACAQNFIIKKGGERINCKIQKLDKRSIYYIVKGDKDVSLISKKEVESFYVLEPNTVINLNQTVTNNDKVGLEKMLLSVIVGAAKPTNFFGSKVVNQTTSGMANTGFVLGFSAIYKVSKPFGLKLNYHYQNNPIDESLLQKEIQTSSPGSGLIVSSGAWRVFGVFGGFRLSAPLIKGGKYFLDFEMMGGYPNCYTPEINYKFKNTLTSARQSSKTRALALLPQLGLRYYATENIAVSLAANYLLVRPTFNEVVTTYSNGTKSTGKIVQEISSVNVMFGVSLKLY